MFLLCNAWPVLHLLHLEISADLNSNHFRPQVLYCGLVWQPRDGGQVNEGLPHFGPELPLLAGGSGGGGDGRCSLLVASHQTGDAQWSDKRLLVIFF